jgi:hypothetical protein
MYIPTDSEPEIQTIGGDPLKGSGFEGETPESAFESDTRAAEEGLHR